MVRAPVRAPRGSRAVRTTDGTPWETGGKALGASCSRRTWSMRVPSLALAFLLTWLPGCTAAHAEGGPAPAYQTGGAMDAGRDRRPVYLPAVQCARTPTVVGRIDVAAFRDLTIGESGLAYVVERGAAERYRILAVDVSDAAAPRVAGASDVVDGRVSKVTAEGRRLYAVGQGRERAIAVYDLAEPTRPRHMSSFRPTGMSPASGGAFRSLVAYHGFAYWTGYYDPIEPAWDSSAPAAFVADLRDPARPAQYEGCGTGPAHDLIVHEGYLYVATVLDHTVHVLSLADPARPREVASLPALGVGGIRHDVRLAASGRTLFAVTAWTGLYEEGPTGVRVIDVAVPEHPRVVADGGPLPWARIGPVAAVEGALFAGFGLRDGVLAFDMSDPTRPALAARLALAAGAQQLAAMADGRHLLALERGVGVHTLSWSPPRLEETGVLRGFWPSTAGDVTADAAYVANGYGVSVIDVTQRSRPREVSFVDLDGEALWVRSRGDELLVAVSPYLRSSLRLHRLDVSAPASPRVVGAAGLDGVRGYPPMLDAAGNVLWAVDQDAGLTAYDLADLEAARVLGRLRLDTAEAQDGWLHGFALGDGLAFVSYGKPSWCGLLVADVSDPTAPRWIGRTPLAPCWAGHVAVGEGRVYAGAADPVVAYDVTDPASPREMARIVTGQGNIGNMVLAGHRLHVAGCAAELRIVDVADPTRPRLVGALPVDLETRVAAVDDDEHIYLAGPNDTVADPDVGLLVVDPDPWSGASALRP